jgi:hypothetical protein
MDAAFSAEAHGAPSSGKCGGTNRQGEPCKNPRGYKTDHPGYGNCHFHGGSSPNGRTAALNHQAAAELARLDVPPVTDPLTELARVAAQAVAWKDAMGAKVNELTSIRYSTEAGGEQLRAEIALWERALDRCVTTLTAIAKLNIEGRLATVREATAQMLEQALQAALASSGCDLEGQERAKEAFRRNLKVA